MALKRYKTDLRLWCCISAVLNAILWYLPISQDGMTPVFFCIDSFSHDSLTDSLTISLVYTLMFGIPAIVLGWILQCLAVMVWGRLGKANADTTGK
jgi:hypothetical protein